ncbi:MAG: metalloregulator ArsR/SmtB family transcription factor [Acidobacteriota bacterium]
MRDFLAVTKALSDETRVRLLLALRDEERCLCQLIDLLNLAPSTISKHMKLLHDARLVEMRKEGRWHFYRVARKHESKSVEHVLAWAIETLADEPTISDDQRRLREISRKDLVEISSCYRN